MGRGSGIIPAIDALILQFLPVASGGTAEYDDGYLDIYQGEFPDPGTDTLLASTRLDTPAAPLANLVSSTDITLNFTDDEPTILADSDFTNPKYFRITKADHSSGALYGSIGLVSDDFDPDLIVSTMTWGAGNTIPLSGIVHVRSVLETLTGYALTPSAASPYDGVPYTVTAQAKAGGSDLHRIGITLTPSYVKVSGTGGGSVAESSVVTNRYGQSETIHVTPGTNPTTEKIHVTDGTFTGDTSNLVVQAQPSFTLVSHAKGRYTGINTGASINLGDTTGANLITVAVGAYSGGPPTITDFYGNTWTSRKTSTSGEVTMFDCINPTVGTGSGGAGHVISVDAMSVAFGAIAGAAWTAPSPSADDKNGNGGTGDISTGAVNPTANFELLVSAVRSDTTETAPLALSDGFTVLEDQDFVSSESVLIGFAYLQQTTAASANPTWSNLSGNTGAVICTYKAL